MIHTFLAAALSLFSYVNEPVAQMREEPAIDSKVISQAYLSEPLNIVEETGDWVKIESTLDGFEGWIQRSAFCQREASFLSDPSLPMVKINSSSASLYNVPDVNSEPLMTLPFESCLEAIEPCRDCDIPWIKVALPDGREAYIQYGDVDLNPPLLNPKEMCALSKSFIGQPSTFDGRTSFGYGCSGFVQMLYREMGINLPRDLKRQIQWEGFDAIPLENLSPGDLVFFGPSEDNIESVGVYLGDDQIIHAAATENTPCIDIHSLSDISGSARYMAGRALKGPGCRNVNLTQNTPDALLKKANLTQNVAAPEAIEISPEAAQNTNAEDSLPFEAIQSIMDTNTTIHDEHFSYYFLNEQKMPLVISPNNPDPSLSSFQTWAESHQSELKQLLSEHSALLLRNFPVNSADEFASVITSVLGRKPMDYRGGEGSRNKVAEGVYTSTEAPPQFQIPLHNELSCTNNPPAFICFYCETAPEPGSGQTIIGSTDRVSQAIKQQPDVWNLFNGRTMKYISRHPPEGNFFTRVNNTHKTWQQAFETNDKQVVERICKEKGFEFQWLGDWIEVTRNVPAIKGPDSYFDHPYWFNQVHLYHGNPRIRGGMVNHILATTLYAIPSTRQYDIKFEDGSSIPRKTIYKIYDILEQETVKFDWNKGDVLILDNIKALHGRAPYKGQRRILASMVL